MIVLSLDMIFSNKPNYFTLLLFELTFNINVTLTELLLYFSVLNTTSIAIVQFNLIQYMMFLVSIIILIIFLLFNE